MPRRLVRKEIITPTREEIDEYIAHQFLIFKRPEDKTFGDIYDHLTDEQKRHIEMTAQMYASLIRSGG